MEYFLQFHWWYIVVIVVLLFVFFGTSRGGIVERQYIADLDIIDTRFNECRPKASYSIFKSDESDHIDIEVDNIPFEPGETLVFEINGVKLADVKVKRNKEAEFNHWANDGVDFPEVDDGDSLVILYKDVEVIKGTFCEE